MKTAVLLALYNGERFLAALLESLCSQTWKDFTVYVHDDGSHDRSLEILRSFSNRLAISLLHDPESGRGSCRSFLWLLEHVDADRFFFADQDDVWLPEKIEKSLKALLELEEKYGAATPCAVCCDLKVVDSELKIIAESFWDREKIRPEKLTSFSYLAGQNIAAGCTMCFNSALKAAALPAAGNPVMHDHYLILTAAAKHGKVKALEEALILYRQHGNNVIGSTGQSSGLLSWILRKLFHLKTAWKSNMAQYRQAKGIAPISLFSYFLHRFTYIFFIKYAGSSRKGTAK